MKNTKSFADLTKTTVSAKPPEPRGILLNHKEKTSLESPKKMGRPVKTEKSTEKITAYLTESEKKAFIKKAGLVKEATFLKHILKEGGYLG